MRPSLVEPLEFINERLETIYGKTVDTNQPIFRVVSTWDQLEKRRVTHTPNGVALLWPEVIEVPKYNQNDLDWRDMYVLERLVIVPDDSEIMAKLSYEPLHFFKNIYNEEPLPPLFRACQFCIDCLYAALGKKSMRKYVDAEAQNPLEEKEKRINGIMHELFGDESFLLGRTITGEAVGYTGPPQIQSDTKE